MIRIPARKGQIYNVADRHLQLPPATQRGEPHATARPFLVLSGNKTNSDNDFPLVLGCPISTSRRFTTEFCVQFGAGEGGLQKKSWVRVVAIQPLDISLLGDKLGELTLEQVAEVEESLFAYMGIL